MVWGESIKCNEEDVGPVGLLLEALRSEWDTEKWKIYTNKKLACSNNKLV